MTTPLVVVLDDALTRTAPTTVRGDSQLTAGLRELLDDASFDVELWCRAWQGDDGHDSDLRRPIVLRPLPHWRRLGILLAAPRLLRSATRIRHQKAHVLSVGPSFSQLALLLTSTRSRADRAPVTWLIRSNPTESLTLTREAANPLVRIAIRGFFAVWRSLLRRQTDIVCVSATVARELGLPQATIAPEIGWDEMERLTRPAAGARGGALFVGRLSPEKGPDIAVDAFAALPDSYASSSLTIVGTGDMGDMLRDRASSLGERVIFTGAQSPAAVADLMRHAAVVLVPSRSEGFGLAAFEAAASGAAVIHSGAGGLDEACGWWKASTNVGGTDLRSWTRALEAALLNTPSEAPLRPIEIRAITGWPSLKQVMHERTAG